MTKIPPFLPADSERMRRAFHPSEGLGLEVGKVYEAAVFPAERHTCESHYRLTLSNFSAGRWPPDANDAAKALTE